jgi:hypothetical protein
LDLAQVLILEAGPFSGHATLKDLSPAEIGLFFDETVERDYVFSFVKWYLVEPGVDAVEKYVDEVRASLFSFAGGAKRRV